MKGMLGGKNSKKLLWLTLLSFILIGCSKDVNQIDGAWKLVYEVDQQGEMRYHQDHMIAIFKDDVVILQGKGIEKNTKSQFTLDYNKLYLRSITPYEGIKEVYQYSIGENKLSLTQEGYQYVFEKVK